MIKKPIIIVGSGRSGSTIFSELLSNHPDFVYLTRFNTKFPRLMTISRFALKFRNFPMFKNIFGISECYPFWDTVSKAFVDPSRNLTDNDVTPDTKKRIIDKFNKLTHDGDSRLLIKITGWSRIGFLKDVFPDAKFIHIVRDGRAVANSLLNVEFWRGWEGPASWRLGNLKGKWKSIYEHSSKSVYTLAGLFWSILIEALEKDIADYNPDILTISYEELCDDKTVVLSKVMEFCRCEWTENFGKAIVGTELRNMNYKAKESMTPEQYILVSNATIEFRTKYGYNE